MFNPCRGEKIFVFIPLSSSYPSRFLRLFFSLLSSFKNLIYICARIPIIHKV
ncbi:unknown protein [Microcystis aeruginosa NIES-843]|uniref:Uncharacterized protein n=1 Tax=Microcystis aeruginosa (strain NIES-843 / IAM M-2473) TaxID=449447 RepID=B0JY68_MICAN|nr:unknown protein [Microcystis aeruginosa NIES-843]